MGFRIRQILSGRLSSSRRQDGSEQASQPTVPSHALDSLPTLPPSRRPITHITPTQQLSSPLFKLPPELRQLIYRLVLSNREIHLDMRYTAVETSTPHSTRGASLEGVSLADEAAGCFSGFACKGRVGGSGELHALAQDAMKGCLLSSMDAVVGGFRRPLVESILAMGPAAFDRLMGEERADAKKVESREGMWLQFLRPLSASGRQGARYWVLDQDGGSRGERTGSGLDLDVFPLSI